MNLCWIVVVHSRCCGEIKSMALYLEGVILGLPLMFLMGPVLMTLLQESLQKGFVGGWFVALGILVGDALCLLLCYAGLSQIASAAWVQPTLTVAGSLVLCAFGVGVFFSKPRTIESKETIPSASLAAAFSKGFVVNAINPFVLTFWLGCMSLANARFNGSFASISLFFSGTLTVIFLSDVSKAYFASFLRKWIHTHRLQVFHRITGLFLIASGLYLLGKHLLS
jgi:threonine/homoserine/homoserine lactone efflux protein